MDPLIQGLTYGTDAVAAQVTSADGVSPRQFQLKAATLDEPLKVGFSYATPDGSYHSQSAELVIDTTQISLAADKSGLESLLASARALKQGEKSDDAFAALTAAIAEAQRRRATSRRPRTKWTPPAPRSPRRSSGSWVRFWT